MPAPLVGENWQGDSVASWETFLSPMAKTSQDVRRARCRGMIYPNASATTVPYSYNMGSSKRRPNGELGIDGHREVGRMIKAVMSSKARPYSVCSRMNSIRSTIEDWMSLEIGRGQLEGPEFFDVYYGELEDDDPLWDRASSRDGVISILEALKEKLVTAYPNCAPLRKHISSIDMSLKLVRRMKASRV